MVIGNRTGFHLGFLGFSMIRFGVEVVCFGCTMCFIGKIEHYCPQLCEVMGGKLVK